VENQILQIKKQFLSFKNANYILLVIKTSPKSWKTTRKVWRYQKSNQKL